MSDLADLNTVRMNTWCARITESGSVAGVLVATCGDKLHICIPHQAKLEDVEKLLTAALAEVRADLKPK